MDAAVLKLAGLTSPGRRPGAGGLDGLNFTPAPGMITAILGAPGAGKSALIRAVAGVERVRGTIVLNAMPIGKIPAARRGFGVVLQPDKLSANRTLADNVAAPLRARGARRPARQVLVPEALALVGLQDLADLRAEAATPAQAQRAMLARAIVFGPRLLLLDEPFSAQPPRERADLILALRHIQSLLGATILVATDVGQDAIAVSQRLAVLRNGAVAQHDATQDLFDHPRNDAVAGLLGEINRLPGRIVEIDDDTARIRLDCGPEVEARPGPTLTPGDPCVLVVRPDRIALALASAADMGGDALDATLIDSQFLGESTRLRLLIGSGAELVVRRPAAAGLRGLAVGGAASVAWQAHHAQAFRIEEGSPFLKKRTKKLLSIYGATAG